MLEFDDTSHHPEPATIPPSEPHDRPTVGATPTAHTARPAPITHTEHAPRAHRRTHRRPSPTVPHRTRPTRPPPDTPPPLANRPTPDRAPHAHRRTHRRPSPTVPHRTRPTPPTAGQTAAPRRPSHTERAPRSTPRGVGPALPVALVGCLRWTLFTRGGESGDARCTCDLAHRLCPGDRDAYVGQNGVHAIEVAPPHLDDLPTQAAQPALAIRVRAPRGR